MFAHPRPRNSAIYARLLAAGNTHITTNLPSLSVEIDEALLRKHFDGVSLHCIGQGPGSDALGDRVCYSSIDRADGDAALTLAAFLRKGKLAHVIVQMPWWVHKSLKDRLMAQYGQPTHAGVVSRFGGPVLRWSMPNGYVETNRDRSFNPLNWNVMIWTGSNSAKSGEQINR